MRIRVNNIPFDTTSRQLGEFFSQFGVVDSAVVAIDRETRTSRGFAFVEMPNDHEAYRAIEAATGKVVNGRRITAVEAPVKGTSDGRFGARGGFR